MACFDSLQSSDIVDCQYVSSDGNVVVYNVTEWCHGDCLAGKVLSLLIKQTTNPSLLAANYPSFYFGLSVFTSEGYAVEKVTTSIVALPALSGIPLSGILISRDNNIVGSEDYLSFVIPVTTLIGITANAVIQLPLGLAF